MRFSRPKLGIEAALLLVVCGLACGMSAAATLKRFPNASATQVVFVAAGDLWVAPLEGGAAKRLTHDPGSVIAPRFSPDGRWIAFRGDESLVATLNSDGIYLAPLDHLAAAPSAKLRGGSTRDPTPFHIDLDGLMSRAVALPVTPAVIVTLEARGSELFYQAEPPQLIGGDLPGMRSALRAFDLGTFADRKIIEGLDSYSLAANGSFVASRTDVTWRITPTRGDPPDGVALDLSALRVSVDPRLSWAEMLQNAWRLDRDVFFSPVMNGTDWQAVHDAYARLWPTIRSQDDFLYLLGQMQGEIASSHTFVGRGADFDPRPVLTTTLLGADYAFDGGSGRYRFAHVYRGDQSRPELRGPLGAPGLDVREGDYLLAVNSRELRAPAAPLSMFVGTKGPLQLSLARTLEGPRRSVSVDPLDDDGPVRHFEWVERNRKLVDRLSGGRLGYIVLSDFADEGSKEFVRQFYPQLDKEGLVLDVRWNAGGFTSQAVLDVLRRKAAGTFVNREHGVSPLPVATPPGVMALVMNYASRSDGDQFPFFFRRYGLGPLVGERTWGGVQGVNAPWRLMDGSFVVIPKDALADRDGRWVIENEGVAPDVAVDNARAGDDAGDDPQLGVAVRACMERLGLTTPHRLVVPPPLPAYPQGGDVPGAVFGPKSPT